MSKTLEDKIRDLALLGHGRPTIMERLPDATEWKVRKVIGEIKKDLKKGILKPEQALAIRKNSTNAQIISDLRPIVLKVPKNKKPIIKKTAFTTVAFVGDTHGRFVDDQALNIACSIISEANIDILVHLGDVGDFYSVSKYIKNPARRLQLQDDVEEAAIILGRLDQAVSEDTRKILIEGNHEVRIKRYIESNAPALATIEDLQVKRLLGLDSIGWEYIDHDIELFPEFLVKHGNRVAQHSGYTARAELQAAWMSGISGHTHRLALHEFTSRRNFIRGERPSFWIENGCLCENEMEYTAGNGNWQQGFTIIKFDKHGNPVPEFIHIWNGMAIYNSKVYTG